MIEVHRRLPPDFAKQHPLIHPSISDEHLASAIEDPLRIPADPEASYLESGVYYEIGSAGGGLPPFEIVEVLYQRLSDTEVEVIMAGLGSYDQLEQYVSAMGTGDD